MTEEEYAEFAERLSAYMAVDKKNIYKKLSYVLLHAIGQSYIYPSDLTFIDEVEEV